MLAVTFTDAASDTLLFLTTTLHLIGCCYSLPFLNASAQTIHLRRVRSPGTDDLADALQLSYTIDMFGASYKLQLQQAVVAAADLQLSYMSPAGQLSRLAVSAAQRACHYRGTVTTCQPATRRCYQGRAALSRFAQGVRGVLKIGGEDILIEPLPETLLARRMRFSSVHIARRRLTSDSRGTDAGDEMEADPQRFDVLDQLANALHLHPLRITPITVTPPDSLQVQVAALVDTPMLRKLAKVFADVNDQVTLVLAAYNAVNMLYDDASIGAMKVRLAVKRVHLDDSGSMPRSEKVTDYLSDLCRRYQRELLARLGLARADWDLTTALTGLDVYADAADVTRDAAYRNLKGTARKIFTVSGVSYGGGMCSVEKNCMVTEFALMFGNIETIAHETGHTLGMYHDGSGNRCDRRGNHIMSIQQPQRQRAGWSRCSTDSLQHFVVNGHAHCLISKPPRD
ncbi:A disintegrin and metalloproteinase with thrombospondin motifs 2-like [Paramacrobiotus metropolitanus]|uniref:A disintegrin and metalloproteinase with thrombospondin motifs 2-like n=1 Tax=Paramacrobiotus metropolitanus TaxID=2943436 RepID=UPI0024459793|nr:A disintegrin and metalloproteinase with thrombospondin motifs 2-like [Paramacrobiotus metropolitanus]XP_055343609.1 A disintegrin and metalloproteinase with thrombospondin motifs 2-like [Paramacrobiotus metropolitanus]XP_055343610.1 A disintegrin and metalloproteinase with thrombospondin motifs 2-like [Paramacrobiotus metropolitanus]